MKVNIQKIIEKWKLWKTAICVGKTPKKNWTLIGKTFVTIEPNADVHHMSSGETSNEFVCLFY